MLKKVLCLSLAAAIASLTFVGCGGESGLKAKGDYVSFDTTTHYKVQPKAQQRIFDFDYENVTITDKRLKELYDKNRQFFLEIDNDDILFQFRQRAGLDTKDGKLIGGWIATDVFNAIPQWFSAFAKMSKINNDKEMLDKINELVNEFAKTIESDGYFMATKKPNAPHYEFEKFVGAMVDVYQYTENEKALDILKTMLSWGQDNLDTDNFYAFNASDGSTEWYTVPETSYKAYLLTGDEEFKTFADKYLANLYFDTVAKNDVTELFDVCDREAKGWYHAYSHLNALNSAAMKYIVDNDSSRLETITAGYDLFRRTQIYPTGGFGPNESLMREGERAMYLYTTDKHAEIPCGSWAIAKFNRYLTQYTGEGKYGQWWEDMLFNGVFAMDTLRKDGAIMYYHNYSPTGAAKVPHNNFSCCSGTYPNSITELYNQIYYKNQNTIYVNQFVSSELAFTQSNGKKMKFVQEFDLEKQDYTKLTIKLQEQSRFKLAFRVPDWSKEYEVYVNDKKVESKVDKGFITLDNNWNNGDIVKVVLKPEITIEKADDINDFPVFIKYGPVVLAHKGEDIPTFEADELNDLSKIVKRTNGTLNFTITLGGKDYKLVPYYDIPENEKYIVTFDPNAQNIANG